MKSNSGFTLLELMIAVIVLSIAATVAVPAFSTLFENYRVRTEANRLSSSLQFARSEAVRAGENITLAAIDGDYNEGWCVHSGNDCSDANQIRTFDPPSGVVASDDGNSVTFSDRGELAAGASFVLTVQPEECAAGESDRQRVIDVGVSGRTQVTRSDCE